MARNGAASRLSTMATMTCTACSMRSAFPRAKPDAGGSSAPRAMTKFSRLRRHCFSIGRRSARFTCAFILLAFLAACDHAKTESQQRDQRKIWEDFSGEKALAHVQAMVDFGPRPPGSEAIEKTRTYLVKQLESAGWKVERQSFS